MSIEAIQQEIASLDDAGLRKIIGQAVWTLSQREDPNFSRKLGGLIDDQTPGRWLTLEEMDRRLGTAPEGDE